MSVDHLSLSRLRDFPAPSSDELFARARRLVSTRTGIIDGVQYRDLAPEEPPIYWASSQPANTAALTGQSTLYRGSATSIDPHRAIMKAVGESVERYCSGLYDDDALVLATYEELGDDAVPPERFALFSARQYARPNARFAQPTAKTPLRWALGYSLVTGRPIYVPAALVYVPYRRAAPREPAISDPISTGLACSPTFATGIYRGILETIERDAFMIVWQNRLRRPHVDLRRVDDPLSVRLLAGFERLPVRLRAVLLTLDVEVYVFLVVITSETGHPPLTVVGLGTDLSPRRALMLALEEAALGFCGMGRAAARSATYRPEPGYGDVTTLDRHGLAHALDPGLRPAIDFLLEPSDTIAVGDLPDRSSDSMTANVRTVVDDLRAKGLDAVVVDLTLPDIDEVGFKVIRAVVPGLQPLDNDHTWQHLGGRRLYEVPWRLGLRDRPGAERDLNPFPHPFP